MAVAFVRKITGTSGNVDSISLIFGANNVAGNFISADAGWFTFNSDADPTSGNTTDTRNTYALDVFKVNGSAREGQWSAKNIGAGANTVVINPPGTGLYIGAVAAEFSGIDTTAPLRTSGSNSGTSDTPTSGNTAAATAASGDLRIGCLSVTSGSGALGIDLPSGDTNLHIQQDANNDQGFSADYQILASGGTQNVSWGTTTDAAGLWAASVAVYIAAGGSPPPPPPPAMPRLPKQMTGGMRELTGGTT